MFDLFKRTLITSLIIAGVIGAVSCGEFGDDDDEVDPNDCSVLPITRAEPPGGAYQKTDPPQVTLHSNKPAIIYYSIDGSPPSPGKLNTYRGSSPIPDIPIDNDSDLLFFAEDACGNQESVRRQTYDIDEAPHSLIEPDGGAYADWLEVLITSTDDTKAPAEGDPPLAGCPDPKSIKIFYTTDGSTPAVAQDEGGNMIPQGYTQEGTSPVRFIVGGDVQLDKEKTVRVQYFSVDCYKNQEPVRTSSFRIDKRAPFTNADPKGKDGPFSGPVGVQLQVNETATIYYTINLPGDVVDPSIAAEDQVANGGRTYTAGTIVYLDPFLETTILKYLAIDSVGNIEKLRTQRYEIE